MCIRDRVIFVKECLVMAAFTATAFAIVIVNLDNLGVLKEDNFILLERSVLLLVAILVRGHFLKSCRIINRLL